MDKRPVRLAVIEDEKISGLRLQEHLAEAGHPVDLFFEGTSFLNAFLASPYDLVITDLKLPGVGGMEILRRVKARRRPPSTRRGRRYFTVRMRRLTMTRGSLPG